LFPQKDSLEFKTLTIQTATNHHKQPTESLSPKNIQEYLWIKKNIPNFTQMKNLQVNSCQQMFKKHMKLATATNFLGRGVKIGQDFYQAKTRAWKCSGNAYVCSFNANHRVKSCKIYHWQKIE